MKLLAQGSPAKTCRIQNEKQISSESGQETQSLGEELLLNLVGAGALSAEGYMTKGPAPLSLLQERWLS